MVALFALLVVGAPLAWLALMTIAAIYRSIAMAAFKSWHDHRGQ